MPESGQRLLQKLSPFKKRVLFFFIILIILIALGVAWFLSAKGTISSLWDLIATIVLAVGGVITPIYLGIFPPSPIDSQTSKNTAVSLTPTNINAINGNPATPLPDPIQSNQEQTGNNTERTTLNEARHPNYEEQQTQPNMVKYNTATIRKLLTEAFSDQDLEDFCMDNFPSVHNRFALGMDKQQKVQRLIEHCDRYNDFPFLLNLVKKSNPSKYKQYENVLINANC